jgi:hypothetical protein
MKKKKNIFETARTIGDDKPVIKRTIKGKFSDDDLDHFLMESTKHNKPKPKTPKKPKDNNKETYVRELCVSVCLRTCQDCRHNDHSGAFTPGGAKQICGHSDAYRWAVSSSAFQVDRKDKDDKYHWKHRVINDPKKIPEWCPLKHGAGY